jgi:hypothetical protein
LGFRIKKCPALLENAGFDVVLYFIRKRGMILWEKRL